MFRKITSRILFFHGLPAYKGRGRTFTRTGQGAIPVAVPASSADCSPGEYHEGEPIGLTASPDTGWSVDSWTGTDDNGSPSTTNTATMPASAHEAGVTYVEDTVCYTLTQSHTGNGNDPQATPVASRDCPDGQYVAGAQIALTATPASGWIVESSQGTADDALASTSNAVTMPASPHTVAVNYVLETVGRKALLVDDDDNTPDVRNYYVDALTAVDPTLTVEIWDTNNSDLEPDASYMAEYSLVLWFTGDEASGFAGPGALGEAALAAYLDGGGCFFLSSQDYLWDRGGGSDVLTSFMSGYLGMASGISDQHQSTVTGSGKVFDGMGTYSLTYPFVDYSDVITPDRSSGSTAALAFSGDVGDAAICKDNGTYRVTFWGFPFEALPAASRTDAMRRIVECVPDWRGPGLHRWF